jgi:hypothetical protein
MTFHAVPRRDPVLIIEFASGSRSAEWLELRRLPQILLVLVRRTINYSKGLSDRNRLAGGSQLISKFLREIEPTVRQFLNVHAFRK